MSPNPILKVLSTLSLHQVRHLLMGGQACVLYGAAEFSRTTDIVVMADSDLIPTRPLLALAKSRDRDSLQAELEVEEKQERQLDRDYWNPLRAELEQLRRREHS